jgi:hypothetical protein
LGNIHKEDDLIRSAVVSVILEPSASTLVVVVVAAIHVFFLANSFLLKKENWRKRENSLVGHAPAPNLPDFPIAGEQRGHQC